MDTNRNNKLARARNAAKTKGGHCHALNYVNARSKMQWECSDGHQWYSTYDSVVNSGSWCLLCAAAKRGEGRRKYNIEFARAFALERGGKCHSHEYKSVRDPMDWECAQGHRWTAAMHNMMTAQSSWCGICKTGHTNSLSLDLASSIASFRGGQCLAVAYKNNKEALTWQCSEGHNWTASLHNVKDRGSWCPTCNATTESLCGLILGTMFPSHTFVKTRGLDWLRTSDDEARLELDLWNEELRLALEYNGRQHYEVVSKFHTNGDADLHRQQHNDRLKATSCIEAMVCLITVPYFVHRSSSRPAAKKRILAEFIWAEVADLGYPKGIHLTKDELLFALRI